MYFAWTNKKRIIKIACLFCFLIQSNISICSINNSQHQSVVTPVVSATKYISIFLCTVYGLKGATEGIKSARLLLPDSSDIKVADIVKFPFKLVFEFPFKACDAIRYFMMAGGFGSYAFFVHQLGF